MIKVTFEEQVMYLIKEGRKEILASVHITWVTCAHLRQKKRKKKIHMTVS